MQNFHIVEHETKLLFCIYMDETTMALKCQSHQQITQRKNKKRKTNDNNRKIKFYISEI